MTSDPTAAPGCCSVVELRQYTLRPGRRDELIELFDRELLEPQEDVRAHVVGQFRDAGDPDRFVWLRGFADMAARDAALRAFYGGPVWRRHRDAANATMVDSDDVLLLRPAWPGAGFAHPPPVRPRADAVDESTVAVGVFALGEEADEATLVRYAGEIGEGLREAGLVARGWFRTEAATNTFPALPVREGERVFVVVASAATRLAEPPLALRTVPSTALLSVPAQVLRLVPTARSRLR